MKTLRYFGQLASPFWFRRQQWFEWLLLLTMLGFALLIIRVSVWITEWNKLFYDALAEFNGSVMPQLVLSYLGYIGLIVAFIVLGNALRKLLIFRWREHLTQQFQQQWLHQHNHYRLTFLTALDNPDQRIAEDCALLAEQSIDLFKYFVMNIAKLGAFVTILWQLSGVQTIELAGTTWTIHGYLVWVALIYSLLCTLFIHFIGHKLQDLNIERQHKEADYRATLLRVRDNSEQIAFYHGEKQEISRLSHRFQAIKQNWFELIKREMKVETFSASYLRLSMFIPIFATLPMYLARTMTFGDMMQARSAFSNVQDGFGWFMDYYKRLIEWAAVIKRLHQFQQALQQTEQQSQPTIYQGEQPSLKVENLCVQTPQGKPLFANFSLNLTACDWVLLEGKSGIGKSTLLRTLAGLWQYYQGDIQLQARSVLFLPQKPYLAEDSLRAVLSYPNTPEQDNARLQQLLNQVGLAHLTDFLDESREWQKQLSGGEQQRISLARALLHRPQMLFLDEATNQLDDVSAHALMTLLRQELAESLCIAISHQDVVKSLFGEQRLKIR
ncbi:MULTISPECIES: ABC transporter ATP-binding protein/permease [Glaesserella]|uniref:ABC transporter ATP-binding protein n=1 Tax=Glaesserella australis TaxID=2094024 RepID=A0A328BYN3_9PAST|nr:MULTISPECIES: ABC transporter ATP-binding protein/permease [Glaesserella]AUI67136.1 ABC transporter ATP-binding protein [Glaesserella sp. 15-184]RAL18192.1 ABC transporter ATP-binding protein [Glaesserella australis]